MVYEIEYSQDAERQLKALTVYWKKTIKAKVEAQLRYEPTVRTGNRKPLRRPNRLNAGWELRVHPYRVYYNVDEDERFVRVVAIGYKPRNDVFVDGTRIEL